MFVGQRWEPQYRLQSALLPQIHHEPLLPVQPTSPKAGDSLYFSMRCEAYVLEFREEAAAEQQMHKIWRFCD